METSNNATQVERTSDHELVVKHTVDAPSHLVFQAWTQADIFRQWWVPKSFGITLLSCEMDVRVGGQYRLVFPNGESTMEFFGTYLEVVPDSRLVWTNEEEGHGETVTTVTFQEIDGQTLVVVRDLFPTAEAMESGGTVALPEAFSQLDELLAGTGAK